MGYINKDVIMEIFSRSYILTCKKKFFRLGLCL